MPAPARTTRAFAASLLLHASLAACLTERVAEFQTGDEIPLRILSLTVGGWEVVPGSRPPLSSLHAPEGRKAIAVFVRWEGLREMGTMDTRMLVETILEHRTTLLDAKGVESHPITAMPRDLYYGSSYTLEAPPDWVIVFHVQEDSAGYTLRVSHPDPGEEGFQIAAVPLR